jgi:uncharacterized membrane protein YccC
MKLVVATIRPLLYGVRMTAAVSLALFVAFYLQLDTPSWAGTTAVIICQPAVGSALLKGAFRMVGTVLGALAAVLLTAAFPQDRFGFLFGMLVWAAGCSFVSTLLRNFAAYAAMLAGYTLIIIAGTSIPAPDQVFEIAINRASEICVGIVAGTLVVGLTDLGNGPKRLSDLLTRLIAETALHLAAVLADGARHGMEGASVRRALIARTAALDPVIDQAAGESPELLQRRSVLRAAVDGLFEALSGARIVETHLRSLPESEAAPNAQIVSAKLPDDWRGTGQAQSALDRDGNVRLVRNLIALETDDVSLRLMADGAADVASGLAAAANGLDLIDEPARARDVVRVPKLVVADHSPAAINALRVFVGVGAVVLFWILTAWPNGPQAVMFAAITIIVFSPMQDRSIQAAFGQAAGTIITAAVVAHLKFFLLINRETFLGLALVIAIGLVPLGALSSVPLLAPYFIPASLNFVPMLSPTNLMTYDVVAYMNTALGLLAGCAAGGLALLLIPHLPPGLQSQRLVDLTVRDLRRLAAGERNWTLREWQNRIYARLIAMPAVAEPVQRSFLVATLSVGIQVIRLSHLARHGEITARIARMRDGLAYGDLAMLRSALDGLGDDLAAVPATIPGARGRLRARSALLAIEDAVNRHSGVFESSDHELR